MRLVIVSNRLPVTAVKKGKEISLTKSVGGLATGLRAYLEGLGSGWEFVWVGWPGITVDPPDREPLKARLVSEFNAVPVFLEAAEMDAFYHGFCNKTIWALFHYFPSYAVYDETFWDQYRHVNRVFSRVVSEVVRPGDVIWIHDYHLMLLPKLLRENAPEFPIGFFLHIPFPSFEVFRLLPSRWRTEILEGLLGANLIGFHTHDYAQYFLRCVQRILGFEHQMGEIAVQDRTIKIDTFPMGIDYQRFRGSAGSLPVTAQKDALRNNFGEAKLILSIDRLDYSKGILHRLRGYDAFLTKNPGWHGKVVLLIVVVPSRVGVDHYQLMKRQIDETVGRINGAYGTITWTPIVYQFTSLAFEPLVALYGVSDVMLVTPLRDGMNLVAKEYIASRTDGSGALILSEMAGASKELGEAIVINPNNPEEISEAIREALMMPLEEQKARNHVMQRRLERYDVVRWARDIIQSTLNEKERQGRLLTRRLNGDFRNDLLASFRKADQRLLLLDYDGTLVPFTRDPKAAFPSTDILRTLTHLGELSHLVLISGRDRNTLQNWFGSIRLGLVAEHGVWFKDCDRDWRMLKILANEWKPQLRPIFDVYADRLPGSSVEEKEFSLVYHFRASDPELASIRIKELSDNLMHMTSNIDVQVLQGNKVIEVRCSGVNKGAAGSYFLSHRPYDFVMAIGDDWTDEDLFRVLPKEAYSIKVGIPTSNARFNLPSHVEVRKLLEDLEEL